jgi:HD-GYP domain-containing protein (c-di-GMP phosphodiesterase class II)
MKMAERIEMEEDEKNTLHWASILHDIGKIGIPEAILNKPGRLTEEEYNIIKGHPETGRDILKPIDQLQDALKGILHHHEHYDGRGYPAGLKGEAIPLLGRIIAVADTFDAITTDRAYRNGKTIEEALAVMKEVTGTQLDPKLFEVFKDVIYEDQFQARGRSHVG